MAVNDATLRLITEFEGFVPNWYPDPAHGWKVPTVGYGHTDAAGQPFYSDTKDKVFSKQEAMEILRRDLGQYENAVNRAVKVPLNANQFGALVSFTYNLGEGNLAKSTLVKKLNAGDYQGASAEFARWNKAGGKVLAGLTRRREAERQLFVAPSVSLPPKDDIDHYAPPDAPMPKPSTPAESNAKVLPKALLIISAIVIVAVLAIVLGPRFFGG